MKVTESTSRYRCRDARTRHQARAETAKADDDAIGLIDGPPEEAFWDKYNKRLEFPLSTVSAVLVHVLIGAVIVFGIFHLMDREADRVQRAR